MEFTGNEAEQIPLDLGCKWTARFRELAPEATKAHFFGKNILMSILNQEGCMGIRAYNAIDDDGKRQLVYVGVNAQGVDLVSGIIAERSIPCPPFCDMTSPLVGASK